MLQKVELRVPICKGYILQRITAFKGIRPNVVTIYCHFLQFIAMVKQPISGSSPGIAAIHLHILRNMNTERTRSGFHPAGFPRGKYSAEKSDTRSGPRRRRPHPETPYRFWTRTRTLPERSASGHRTADTLPSGSWPAPNPTLRSRCRSQSGRRPRRKE